MAQQTAVEWLIEQLVELDKELDGIRKSDDSTVIKLNPTRIYDQAKQMEKEQIINAWASGVVSKNDMTAEQYYNEKYESNTRV
jgi:pyruvate/2-oxoglutarate dehydrogenase complex dihydrolipoamide acyltransferase (E2) component